MTFYMMKIDKKNYYYQKKKKEKYVTIFLTCNFLCTYIFSLYEKQFYKEIKDI